MKRHSIQSQRHERIIVAVQENGAGLKIFALIVFFALFGFSAMAQGDFVINSSNILTGYNGAGGDIVIPDGVLGIGDGVFAHNNTITSVAVPASVQSIGDYAFMWSSMQTITFASESQLATIGEGAFTGNNLTFITIPASVQSIGVSALAYCASLQQVIFEEGSQLITIGDNTFDNSGLISITIPASVQTIGEQAFLYCFSLRQVFFEEGSQLTTIGDYAFYQSALTAIDIPASVQNIGRAAFYGDSNLANVTVHWANPATVTLDESVFFGIPMNAVLHVPVGLEPVYQKTLVWSNFYSQITNDGFIINSSNILIGYNGTGGDIMIPDRVAGIGYGAFVNNQSITSVSVPASVQSIGDEVFEGCSSLQTVTFEQGSQLTTIGDFAFYINDLTSITIPASVQTIGAYAFSGNGLTSITIPASVQSIGDNAFEGCLFQTVTFEQESQLVTIGNSAFSGNYGLTSITIPASVQTIGYGAFIDCFNLQQVIFDAWSQLTTIGFSAFLNSSLTSITIPASVQTIGSDAFGNCSLLQSVTFGQGSQLATIGESVFYMCDSLTAIDIPESVQNIEDNAFYGDSNLANVTVHWADPAQVTLGDDVFFGIPANATLYVPAPAQSLYESDPVWQDFYKIVGQAAVISINLDKTTDLPTARIVNTGNIASGKLTLALSGANADVFALSSAAIDDLAAGAEIDIILTPAAGLAGGIYTAKLTVSGDGIESQSIDISYNAANTGIGNVNQIKPLVALVQNGTLHVNGLTAGKSWSVYNVSGALVYQSIAASEQADIPLAVRGVYFVQSGKQMIKIVY